VTACVLRRLSGLLYRLFLREQAVLFWRIARPLPCGWEYRHSTAAACPFFAQFF
jgi:hypothetical protein